MKTALRRFFIGAASGAVLVCTASEVGTARVPMTVYGLHAADGRDPTAHRAVEAWRMPAPPASTWSWASLFQSSWR